MYNSDPRVDAYIAGSVPFAQPILAHLRKVVHAACPPLIETLKWGAPHFTYRERNLCAMAAFKRHVAFGFWLGALVVPASGDTVAMGQFGRLASLADVPPEDVLAGYVRQAMALTEAGVKRVPASGAASPRPALPMPDDLAAALRTNALARATFDRFNPSQRRDYLEWIDEAKRADTRARRLAQTLTWLAEGKPRHWKYLSR